MSTVALPELVPPAWMDAAACQGLPLEMFFTEREDGGCEPARAVCRGCAVQAECLAYALEHHVDHGLWGGLSVKQRQRIRRQRARRTPARRSTGPCEAREEAA